MCDREACLIIFRDPFAFTPPWAQTLRSHRIHCGREGFLERKGCGTIEGPEEERRSLHSLLGGSGSSLRCRQVAPRPLPPGQQGLRPLVHTRRFPSVGRQLVRRGCWQDGPTEAEHSAACSVPQRRTRRLCSRFIRTEHPALASESRSGAPRSE